MMIRPLRPGEGKRAAELVRACPGAVDWPADDYERLAADAGPERVCLIVEQPPGTLAGLLVACTVAEEAELLNIAVLPEQRRLGLGTELLAEALRRLAAAGARKIWLEVRESNQPALVFYRQHGFTVLGRRRAYYRAPMEDALLLGRELHAPSP